MGDLIVVPPNNLQAVAQAIDAHDPACVIVESTGGRWGVVPLDEGFLAGLRELTAQKDVIFILDEVISGFRVHPGGVQGQLGITPDLTTMAKVLAGGLPGGCVAGKADLMEAIAFDNPYGKKIKHPGTFNANPLSAAAGSAALAVVSDGEPCRKATETAVKLRAALNELFQSKSVNWAAYGVESLTKIHPEYDGPAPVGGNFRPFNNDFAKLDRTFDSQLGHAFRCALLVGGVDWMGWGGMTSAAHTEADIDHTLTAFANAIDLLRADRLVD
jgi:glutamate-1-semialdehyde 2,1-aminomutase